MPMIVNGKLTVRAFDPTERAPDVLAKLDELRQLQPAAADLFIELLDAALVRMRLQARSPRP
jgi:hypothetical protein